MSNDESEKTSILPSDTLKIRLQAADSTPSTLVVLIGPSGFAGKEWPLTDGDYIVGRSPECKIYIDDRSVSKNHAKVVALGGEVTITDLGSTNKTVVGEKTLPHLQAHILEDKDQIKLGNVILKFMKQGSLETVAHQELRDKALRDALTGAYNRTALQTKGPEAIKRADVLNEELSLLVLDVDFFKRINDGYGHAAGDYVLKRMAEVIHTKLVRGQDFFARYGGEEFVILLAGTALASALDVAERVRSTIENTEFVYENQTIPVNISIGVTSKIGAESTWESFFKRADDALYFAKKNGRNRVHNM